MRFIKKYEEHKKDRLAEKYKKALLLGKIRLLNVPVWLRLDHQRCGSIYTTAFSKDRDTSDTWYKEDLLNLEADIELAKSMDNIPLVTYLTHIYHQNNCDISHN